MKLLDWLRPRAAAPRRTNGHFRLPPQVLRWFDMAKSDRLTASWVTGGNSINSEIYHGLQAMRARSQDLEANNEYFKTWVEKLKANVVGPRGVRLQMRVTDDGDRPDEMANRMIEEAWRDFSAAGNFDVSGRLSRADVERLFIAGAARDGEALIRMVPGYDNAAGFAVQVVDPARLDLRKNSGPQVTGDSVVMGVEQSEFGRPERYWILRQLPGATAIDISSGGGHRVIEARDVIHAFIALRPEQSRGVPWAHAASIALRDLGGYREAAIVAARVGAAKLFWIRSASGDGAAYAGVNADGSKAMTAEPGEAGQLGPDDMVETWDPTYPHDQFAHFNKAMLRGIAGALGISYHSLAGDLESVNFTSGRLGAMEDRDGWMAIQEWMIQNFHARIFPEWLRVQLATGRLNLPLEKFSKFNAPSWHPRRWEHVQPREAATADGMLYGLRAKSLTEIIEARGQRDRDEVFAEIQRDEAELARLGLTVTMPTTVQPADDGEAMQ